MIHKTVLFDRIMELASEHCVTLAVMGGYPRDLALGKTPKDLDLCAYNTTPDSWQSFASALHLDKIAYSASCGDQASCSGDDRVVEVLKIYNVLGADIDIILWDEQFDTLQSIADSFDFNINQWALLHNTDLEGQPVKLEASPVFLGDYKDFGVTTMIRVDGHDISEARYEHMRCVSLMLGWKEPAPYVQNKQVPSKENVQPQPL